MRYEETLSWLYGLETMGIKLGLHNVTELLRRMGDPHRQFRSVHVAGTNGKGSVCAMTESILRSHGYATGLYTSPHLVDFTERIQTSGTQISQGQLCRLAEEVRGHVEDMVLVSKESYPTFFEVTTAIAFAHFAEAGVEEAVVEVGMGGRLDATNVIQPDCTAITRISLEHTQYLGDTLEKIAAEKAGIIKHGVPVVTAEDGREALGVIEQIAAERKAPLRRVGAEIRFDMVESTIDGTTVRLGSLPTVTLPLLGNFQSENAALAYGIAIELPSRGVEVGEQAILEGLRRVRWPGRLELVHRRPTVVFDVSHTPDGARAVASDVRHLFGDEALLILGVLNDKDLDGIAKAFSSISDKAIAVSPASNRAFSAHETGTALRRYMTDVREAPSVAEALSTAVASASEDDVIIVAGSLYTVGEAKAWWEGHEAR